MKRFKRQISSLLAVLLFLSIVPGFEIKAAADKITVDGSKDALWTQLSPLGKSEDAGWQGFHITDFYLTSDEENLYFWVDAKNVPNWGEKGQYINIALNVDDKDSGQSENPWGGQFDFSGTAVKPSYHITLRVKNDNEVNGAALYDAKNLSIPIISTWGEDGLKGAQFAVQREKGFEGKIPLSLLGLSKGSRVKAIVVLSGNNENEHGAFDVIPENPNNKLADSWNESSEKNIQGSYSSEYVIGSPDNLAPVLRSLEGPEVVILGETVEYVARLSGDGSKALPASEINWSVTDENGAATNMASISEEGRLTAKALPDRAFMRSLKVVAERKSNSQEIVRKTVAIIRSETPKINKDGTVTFYAEHQGETLNLVGSMNGWDNKGIPMTKNSEGIFEVTIPLGAGEHQYKFFPISGSWDNGFTDPANSKNKDGNSVIFVPGVKITSGDSIQKGTSKELTASFINEEGIESDIKAAWTLKAPVEGVSIKDGSLVVANEAESNAKVTIIAEYNGYRAEQQITIVANMYTYNIHYYRYDGKARDWALWIWEDGKEGQKVDFTDTTESGFARLTHEATVSKLNVIPRTKDSWESQEPTKVVNIQSGNSVDVWIIQGVDTVFYNEQEADISPRVRSAMMDELNKIYVNTTAVISEGELDTFTLKDSSNKKIAVTATRLGDTRVELTIASPKEMDVRKLYTVESKSFKAAPVVMRRVLDNQEFFYGGDDLGVTYSSQKSTFKLWAPTAEKVSLAIYDSMGSYNEQGIVTEHSDGKETPMNREDKGVWSLSLNGDYEGKYYMYKVEFANGTVNYAVDPYATAVAPNGQRGAILNLARTNPESFQDTPKPGFIKATDAILYELHVRDFSIDESSGISKEYQGRFKAFTEEGTTLPNNSSIKTGIDHLKELGITHVHLLPSYDYKTVNEMSKEPQFNWGYDPQNYNVPEGSYATSVLDPAVRIKEFKELVQALHENGIRVIMDVVYNHTYESLTSSFDLVVPGYYYRTDENGGYLNGSGTGNEVASERPMVRKYIKDSVRYWAEEYDIDGFRFDLMGLIDTTTMTQINNELKLEVDPSILVYGEPWDAGTNGLPAADQTKKGSQRDKDFAVFNDNLRGAIKGDSDGEGKGFASGAAGQEEGIVKGLKGAIDDFTNSPAEAINYVTAHDNLNLWDKFIYTQGLKNEVGFLDMLDGSLRNGGSVEEAVEKAEPYKFIDPDKVLENETVKRTLLANGIVFTSQGIPFFQAGDEFLRTKYGDHNSYKSPDAINKIRWENKEDFKPVFDYYKGLIELRRSHPAFRMDTKSAIESNLVVHKQADNIIVYELKNFANGDTWKNIVVIYNANKDAKEIALPHSAEWNVVVDHKAAGNISFRKVNGNKVSVSGLSMMVLYDEEAESYEKIPTTIELSKESLGIEAGTSVFVSAIVKDQHNRIIPDARVTWTSSHSSVVSITQDGRITAIKDGSAVITAKSGDAEASLEVKVGALVPTAITIRGESTVYTTRTTALTAEVKDQFGQIILAPVIQWSSSNPRVATVNSSGLVTGISEGTVVITAKAGEAIKEHTITVKPYERRFVHFRYVRPNGDYEGWNIWVWNTGVKDGHIDFTEIREDGAFAVIEIAPETKNIGFVLRKGTNWEEKDAYPDDRFIITDIDQTTVKVTVTTGVRDFFAIPAVRAPEINQGKVTFNYRDEALFAENNMGSLKGVSLKINGKVYEMEYIAEHELYTYTLDLMEEGTYEYTYIVTDEAGNTKEISDPKNTVNGKSQIIYVKPKVDIKAEVKPESIDYSENALVNISVKSDQPVKIREAYINLTSIGGGERVAMDTELMAHTIAVKDSITAGEKTLPIILVDEYGNEHSTSVTLKVKTRQIIGEHDFDWDEARIYFLLTDRFNNGDPSNDNPNGEDYDKNHPETYHGGDLKGITQKLDYLKALGINTLWISPIVDNIDFNMAATWGGDLPKDQKQQYGYHGYWAKDFEKLDEHFGTIEDLKELIDEAHARGIKIMLDVVVNHAGYGMRDTDTNPQGLKNFPTEEEQAKFKDMLREPGLTDLIKGDLSGLPDFKTEEPEVRETIIRWQTAWLERAKTDKGNTIDYFRIDTVNNVEGTTLKALKNALTEINPGFKVIGEAYGATGGSDGGQLRSGQMDSILDFSFKNSALNFVGGRIDSVEAYLEEINNKIDNTATLGLFLGSHDEDGFLTRLTGTEEEKLGKLKAAAALQITAKGQPIIYYGEELGASGRTANNMDKKNGNFNENRYDMPWDRLEEPEFKGLHDHYQTLLQARAEYSKVFAKGSRTKLGGGDAEKFIAFSRSYKGDSLVVAINTDIQEKAVTIAVPFDAGSEVKDIYSGTEFTVAKDGTVTFDLPSIYDGATVILAETDPKDEEEEPGPGDGEQKPGDEDDKDDGEKPGDGTGKNPKTGDTERIELFIIMAALTALGGAALIVIGKKRKIK